MTTTALSATTTALLDTLADAIEAKDASAVAAHYAPDATLSLLDRDPPADPAVYAGSAEIEAYYRDICGRKMDHRMQGPGGDSRPDRLHPALPLPRW